VLILTPVKNAAKHMNGYFALLRNLSYPSSLLSLGIMDSDSADPIDSETLALMGGTEGAAAAAGGRAPSGTLAKLLVAAPGLVRKNGWRRVSIARHDFGYSLAREARHGKEVQLARRSVLARSRNHLLSLALRDEEWVLWIDADLKWFPADVIERLVRASEGGHDGGREKDGGRGDTPLRRIIVPNCVMKLGGGRSYDLNSWRGGSEETPGDRATAKEVLSALEKTAGARSVGGSPLLQGYSPTGVRFLQHFRSRGATTNARKRAKEGDLTIWLEPEALAVGSDAVVRLDAVGGAMLLVHADLHRSGLIFPPFSYRLRIETEGLSMMALDMGVLSWGMPFLEVLHN
jgi:hypothetical protein